jgi:hypothetical protein
MVSTSADKAIHGASGHSGSEMAALVNDTVVDGFGHSSNHDFSVEIVQSKRSFEDFALDHFGITGRKCRFCDMKDMRYKRAKFEAHHDSENEKLDGDADPDTGTCAITDGVPPHVYSDGFPCISLSSRNPNRDPECIATMATASGEGFGHTRDFVVAHTPVIVILENVEELDDPKGSLINACLFVFSIAAHCLFAMHFAAILCMNYVFAHFDYHSR